MAGLVPAIHVFPGDCEGVDAGDKRRHDEAQPIARAGEIMQ
jgi:hypothetical protein